MRYKATVMYDGTSFCGFQVQPGLRSVQGVIEDVLTRLLKEKIKIQAAGRTDAKVHALGQVFHFDTGIDMENWQMKNAMNSHLPKDVYVKDTEKVADDFHARYSASLKKYVYVINFNEYNPLYRNYCWYHAPNLDIGKMKDASEVFIGEHDFKSFSKDSNVSSTTRRIDDISFSFCDEILKMEFTGNGFLHCMIRMIVGMLVEVGMNKTDAKTLKEILSLKKRGTVKKAAPPSGLYLKCVEYRQK